MHKVIIRGFDLSAGYSDTTVVQNASFEIKKNSTTVFMGPGSAGKSTLVKLISKSKTYRKVIWFKGDLQLPWRKPIHLEQKPPRPDCTLYEYFCEVMQYPERDIANIWKCAPGASSTILSLFDTPYDNVPLNIQRLSEFTKVLSYSSDYIILDEPDAESDENSLSWIIAKLNEIRGTTTIIVVTHNLGLGESVSDYSILMVSGSIIEAGDTKEFFENPITERTKRYLRTGS